MHLGQTGLLASDLLVRIPRAMTKNKHAQT
jgi:hypothetical protein